MGKFDGLKSGKLAKWELVVRWTAIALSMIGAFLGLAIAIVPAIRNGLLDWTSNPVFEPGSAPLFGDLSVLLLTYAFLALSRQRDRYFYPAFLSFLLSLGLWWGGAIGVQGAATLALYVAVLSLIWKEVRNKERVWIWTDVPERASE